MKLASFVAPGGERHIGALLPGERALADFTASDSGPPFRDMLALIDAGEPALAAARALLASPRTVHELAAVKLLAPLPQPRRLRDFLCFEKHYRQSRANRYLFGMGTERIDPAKVELPKIYYDRPIYCKGNHLSVVGTGAEVHWPAYSKVIDYELEIGMVTSRGGKNIKRNQAAAHIFGYTIFNDFSARDTQFEEMQGGLGPTKGKDFDTGNAMGPWLVTADEIPDPQSLTMVTRVNGEEWSRGNSREMRHSFYDVIAYASTEETLYAGEVLGSGTVGGGSGNELGRFLKHGDEIELEVSGIGILKNRIVAPHVPAPPPFPIKIMV